MCGPRRMIAQQTVHGNAMLHIQTLDPTLTYRSRCQKSVRLARNVLPAALQLAQPGSIHAADKPGSGWPGMKHFS